MKEKKPPTTKTLPEDTEDTEDKPHRALSPQYFGTTSKEEQKYQT
jgi:hypothetical protein